MKRITYLRGLKIIATVLDVAQLIGIASHRALGGGRGGFLCPFANHIPASTPVFIDCGAKVL